MQLKRLYLLLIPFTLTWLSMTLFAAAQQATPYASSTFDRNNAGWRVQGDAQGSGARPPIQIPVGGNPTGYIRAVDDVSGDTWFWKSPNDWAGDASSAHGLRLTFDLFQQTDFSDQYDTDDVILIGDDGTTRVQLVYQTRQNPRRFWTSYDVELSADAGWKKLITGDLCYPPDSASSICIPATQDDMAFVLANFETLYIRGEFENGSDEGGLDNVIFGNMPTGTTIDPDTARDFTVDGVDVSWSFEVPSGAVTEPVSGFVAIVDPVIAPPINDEFIDNYAQFTISQTTRTAFQFSQPVTVTAIFDVAAIDPLALDGLRLMRWDGVAWVDLGATRSDGQLMTTTETDGTFAVVAPVTYDLFLPLIQK